MPALDRLIEAMVELSHERVGALVALQQGIEAPGPSTARAGVEVDAKISSELFSIPSSIPRPPCTMAASSSIKAAVHRRRLRLPVGRREGAGDRAVGLRHRAAMGVSGRNGMPSLIVSARPVPCPSATRAVLDHDLEPEELRQRLDAILGGMLNDDAEEGTDTAAQRTQRRGNCRRSPQVSGPCWPPGVASPGTAALEEVGLLAVRPGLLFLEHGSKTTIRPDPAPSRSSSRSAA